MYSLGCECVAIKPEVLVAGEQQRRRLASSPISDQCISYSLVINLLHTKFRLLASLCN